MLICSSIFMSLFGRILIKTKTDVISFWYMYRIRLKAGGCAMMNEEKPTYIGSSDGWGPDWNAILNTRKQNLNAYPDIWICRDGSGEKIYGPFLSRSEAADCWMDLDSPVVMHMPDGSRIEIKTSELHVPGEGY